MLYRAYIVSEDGHYIGIHELECESQDEALVAARRLLDGHDIEVWYRGRFVARLNHANDGSG